MASVTPDQGSPVPPSPSAEGHKSNKREKRWSNSSRASNIPTTLSLKSKDQIDAEATRSDDSMFGVESLQDTIHAADRLDAEHHAAGDDQTPADARYSTFDHPQLAMPFSFNTREQLDYASAALNERPLSLTRAPHLHQSPALDSGPLSTPKSASMRSFRLSDDDLSIDGMSSQALASSDEGDADDYHNGADDTDLSAAAAAAPQLVMPSIRMPARRPFTENGKHLGKLKLMVAGAAGVGKTSLIRSIVQTCEDIVHVDPLNNNAPALNTSLGAQERRHSASTKAAKPSATPITEVQASTRAYPSWWHETDEGRVLKRRRSISETVLERNISFVDTPGFHDRLAFESYSASVIDYIQRHLHRNAALGSLSEGEVLNLLSGSGGFQVDLIIYMLSGLPDSDELALMRQLANLTNLVPVMGHADLSTNDEIESTRVDIAQALHRAGVSVFDLRQHSTHDIPPGGAHSPFSVSCASSRDEENMDASLLMSSGYMPPLEPSHLHSLVKAIFEPEVAACLRHTASRKYLLWHRSFSVHAPSMSLHSLRPGNGERRTAPSPPHAIEYGGHDDQPTTAAKNLPESSEVSSARSAESGMVTTSQASSPIFPLVSANSYAMARITDHTQREERLAQAHLARWAADLQRALRNERARFAALQQAERQGWLQNRLEECLSIEACKDGKVGSDAMVRRVHDDQLARRALPDMCMRVSAQDPMGLLELQDLLSRRGLFLARVVGSAGMVGAIVVWAMRMWGGEMDVAFGSGLSWRGSWSWTSEG